MSPVRRTPQTRTLVRTSGLPAFRQALVDLALAGRPFDARRRVVVVPTRAAAELLRQTIEGVADLRGQRAVILPDLVTRDEWIGRLHASLPDAPPLLSRTAREVLLARAAREAGGRTRMGGTPFELRPGLVAELLAFFDELRLRQRTVRRFARVIFDELRGERGSDRGSESLIHQASFMGFAFLGYERGVAESGGLDEHALRRRLLAVQPTLTFDHVVLAVTDRPSDPRGLWPADFDLLGRLEGCTRIDVVMTDETHDAGFRERLEEELPEVVEVRASARGPKPILISPGGTDPSGFGEAPPCVVSRDREEELRDVVRRVRARAAATAGRMTERTAVVFQRPLPYLYLADPLMADAGVPCHVYDALPLASEPAAALVDLVLTMARTGGTREATVALLRSPLVRVVVDGVAIEGADAGALDVVLRARQVTADAATYAAEVDAWAAVRSSRERVDPTRARRAAQAAAAMADALRGFTEGARASDQVGTITGFIRAQAAPSPEGVMADRGRRARAAVLGALDDLAEAFRRHDDGPRDPDGLTAQIHHVLEALTVRPDRGQAGLHLLDAVAARFGEFDHLHLVGLVETDWPERTRRSIFFTSPLLTNLGWPQQSEHTKAELAAFRDLVASASRTVTLHGFQLEGDAVVALSPLVRATHGLLLEVHRPPKPVRIFADEVLTGPVPEATLIPEVPAAWLALRLAWPRRTDLRYQGQVGPRPPEAYRVTAVDNYVQCPFKYFASAVLNLPEERDDVAGLTPIERGTLLHTLLERFYRTWQDQHGGTITREALPTALDLFRELALAELASLPLADRALEADRLLGSIASTGVADRVFQHEAKAGGTIVNRLIEESLRGAFRFPMLNGFAEKTIEIRGKADRLDLFDDGSLRVIDYKLSKAPGKDSIQIGVYAHCVQQVLESRDGTVHPVRDAAYLAFRDDKFASPLGKGPSATGFEVHARASAFAKAVEQIEAGEFPPRPARFDQCQWCPFSGVCRKEYRMEPDATDAL